MIFVTVGTHTLGFERLVMAMDQAAREPAMLDRTAMNRTAGEAAEEVVIQLGATRYRPRCASWFTFADSAELERLTRAARVVVSHAGAGTILLTLRLGKPLVVMPRRKCYHEHGDDHQVELARALEQSGALLVAETVDQLPARLQEAATFRPAVCTEVPLPAALRAALIDLCGLCG